MIEVTFSTTTLNSSFNGATMETVIETAPITSILGSVKIDAQAVTYAKMQNVSAASRLLGRGDSGAGSPQEIALGTGLSMSGTTLNVTAGGTSYNTTIGNGSATSFNVNHALNSRNVMVVVYETNSPYAEVKCGIEHLDANNITVKANPAPSTNEYTVYVVKV